MSNISDDFLYKYIPKAEAAQIQRLENTGENAHAFSDRFLRKMRALIRQEQRSAFGRFAVRFGRAAAAVLIFGILLNAVLIVTVDAYREKFVQIIETVTEEFTSIVTDRKDDAPTTGLIPVEPPYIPEGFTLVQKTVSDIRYTERYTNGNGQEIYYDQVKLVDGQALVDTENAKVQTVIIDNQQAVLIEKDGIIQVYWFDEDYRFMVISNTNRDLVLKIARKIIKNK